MDLLFLGTGAADWAMVPNDEDKNDMGAKIRRPSSMLIDSHILIDPGPSSFEFAKFLGVDLSRITDIFITHTHCDHYNAESLLNFSKSANRKINLWLHKNAVDEVVTDNNMTLNPVNEFCEYSTEYFKVTPLTANHEVDGSDEQPLHYYFEIDGKTLFYGCDGGWLLSRTCSFFSKHKFDCAVLDTTVGDYDGDVRLGSHNSIPMVRMIREYMYKNNMATKDTLFVMSHLARTLHTSIADTQKAMQKENFIVAYDSMRISF